LTVLGGTLPFFVAMEQLIVKLQIVHLATLLKVGTVGS
jgi:hypothetical protein